MKQEDDDRKRSTIVWTWLLNTQGRHFIITLLFLLSPYPLSFTHTHNCPFFVTSVLFSFPLASMLSYLNLMRLQVKIGFFFNAVPIIHHIQGPESVEFDQITISCGRSPCDRCHLGQAAAGAWHQIKHTVTLNAAAFYWVIATTCCMVMLGSQSVLVFRSHLSVPLKFPHLLIFSYCLSSMYFTRCFTLSQSWQD